MLRKAPRPGPHGKCRLSDKWRSTSYGFASSGNAAFDDYKRTQLARLEEERRKLDEEQKAFREHLARLRKAKDQDEFDRFMAERKAPPERTASHVNPASPERNFRVFLFPSHTCHGVHSREKALTDEPSPVSTK